MNISRRTGVVSAAALLFLVLGCSDENAAVVMPKQPEHTESQVDFTASPAETTHEQESEAALSPETDNKEAEQPAEKDKNNISVASPEPETIDPEEEAAAPESTPKPPKRNYDATGAFDPALPTLMGIAIGDDKAKVTELYGIPHETFALPDEAVDASVFAYPGFSVGIRDAKVLFVEVSTRSVNPGLSGLRFGDTREKAMKTLGEPTTSTDYVLTYIGGGTILKMDIDPETKTIHSIKLFPEE